MLQAVLHALLAPIAAVATFIGSMGSAVISGVVLHALFAFTGLIPDRDVRLAEQANLELNHTFVLNLVAVMVVAVLLGLQRWSTRQASAAGYTAPQ